MYFLERYRGLCDTCRQKCNENLQEDKSPKVPDMITLKDKTIAEKLELDDRVEISASRDSFITLKDHKPDFINNPTCRLINPSKSEIGIISKNILDCINKEIIQATKLNMWKSTNNTIEWFKAI